MVTILAIMPNALIFEDEEKQLCIATGLTIIDSNGTLAEYKENE